MTATAITPTLEDGIAASVRLGLVRAEPIVVAPSGPELVSEIDRLCGLLRVEHAGKNPSEIPGLLPARELYRAFGVDPTKTRPSSEALLRRVIKGKPFPRISNAVDLCNYFALRFLLSLGLYDADKIQGPATLRRGRPGESFAGIRKDEVHVGGRIVLADAAGPFGNPSSDSLRTSVDASTRSLWMVIFAPASFPPGRLEEHVGTCRDTMRRFLAPEAGNVQTTGTCLP